MPSGGNEECVAPELSRMRANVFRMLSGLFLAEPAEELLEKLALEETWEIIGWFAGPGSCQPLRDLAQSGRLSAAELRAAFHALFHVPLGAFVFPFESCYRVASPPGPLMGPPAIEVQSAYAAAGFATVPELAEPPDHAGVELAFVAALLDEQAAAQEAGDEEKAAAAAGRIQAFCRDHLGRWLPALRDRIRSTGVSAFYTEVAALAAGVVEQAAQTAEAVPG
jgi:TorA maturation chaperone TorD